MGLPRPTAYLHAALITGMVFLLIGFLDLVTFNSHYFAPFNNGIRDYEVTDILFSQLRDPEQVKRENRVVLVHVSKFDRSQIGELLDRIASQSPAVIGVDILFPEPQEPAGDYVLAASIAAHRDLIVLAANLLPFDADRAGIPGIRTSDSLFSAGVESAYTNFLSGTDYTIRLFSPFISTLNGERHDAFAVALARRYTPERVGKLAWRRGDRPLRINYSGDYRGFLRVDGQTVLDSDDPEALVVFRDRIVIVGFIDSRQPDAPMEDRYFTPLNPTYTGRSLPDMYGAVIHANIVSMLLDGRYIYELPNWLVTLMVIVFTYINVVVIHWIYHNLPDSYHGVTRIMQLVELFLLFFLVALLFYYFRLKIDFTVGFLALVVAYDMVMIYESFIRKRIPYLNASDHD
ncbi:CHASE2 domain-containing protein [Neolewinella litorea]|uniref:CHASE2 domain-containing protein n=1 Tax=Neolewinella litorea TaxID=2562452 RepID=A0A4S4NJ52_9BACT|nr:CHASE2 domain-containing protein [Neolewinella litorea]THH39779.1 CHASE2 domain-containing protein [Neolewinella litorea]